MACVQAARDPTVSVIVVNYASAAAVEAFVATARASQPPALEILVVDNASPDDSLARLRALDGIALIESPANLGFGGGCDLGASRARGELLAFANPDVLLEPGSLGALARTLAATPDVAIAFPAMQSPGDPPHPRRSELEEVATMAGALMVVRREHHVALGGFDPAIFLYWEDTDLCWRTWLHGERVVKDWSSLVHHGAHGSGGGPAWSGEQIRNGLRVHLRLRPWPAVARFAVRMAAKTVVRGVTRRDPSVARAWLATMRTLRPTLVERRALLAATTPQRRAHLEVLCARHDHWARVWRRRALRARLDALLSRR